MQKGKPVKGIKCNCYDCTWARRKGRRKGRHSIIGTEIKRANRRLRRNAKHGGDAVPQSIDH